MEKLTTKEEEVLELIWECGACAPKDVVEMYPEPKPHVNTVATAFQSLEKKGYLTHRPQGRGYLYEPTVRKEDYGRGKLSQFVRRYFGNSYKNVVSAFVQDEKVSETELLDLLRELKESRSR